MGETLLPLSDANPWTLIRFGNSKARSPTGYELMRRVSHKLEASPWTKLNQS
jgi:hypothetical protein